MTRRRRRAGPALAPLAPREIAHAICRAALDAVEPGAAVRAFLSLEEEALVVGSQRYPLAPRPPGVSLEPRPIERIWVAGAGKASVAMASACEQLLGDRIAGGVVLCKPGGRAPLARIEIAEAGHPIQDRAGCEAAARLASGLDPLGERDLLLALISGGGSSLLAWPAEGIGLEELAATGRLLLGAGVPIAELNAVRRHLTRLGGGGLAARAAPARVAALILSDVVGSPLEAIASGPTAPDPTSFDDALATLERHGLRERVPTAVLAHLEAGRRGELPETLKPGDPRLGAVQNQIVGDGTLAATAAAERARGLGLRTQILSTRLEGEAHELGGFLAGLLRGMAREGHPLRRPACLIAAGESTVTLGTDPGHGGRNQELALAAALALEGESAVLLVSLASDGEDGPTDAGGALCDGETVTRARALGLDPRRHLARHDAYPVFAALGDLLRPGPTGTNVGDLVFLLAL
jgi:hydroxypyruvate reductase